MARGTRSIPVVVVAALALGGCGARVAPYLGAGAGGLPGGQPGTPGAAAIGTTVPGQANAPSAATAGAGGLSGSQGASGPTSGGGGGGNTSAPAPQGFSFDPRAEAAACTGTQGNTASDTGVTPTSITFGNVSGLTGPLSNNFNQGAEAVTALFRAVDAAGGICGRQLQLTVEDDGQNSSTNAADVADLIPKVFAFVGSTSDADNGGVPEMTQANIPDVGFAINCNRSQAPVYWSAAGGSCATLNGRPAIGNSTFLMWKQYGYFPQHMAFLAYSIAISAQAAQQFAYVYQHMGGNVCYTDYSISPATASLSSDVVQMQQKGCDGVITTMDVTGNAKLLQAMQQQQYHPMLTATTFDGYTPAQISTAGESAAQGLVVTLPFVPLNENNATVQLYLSQLATYEPGKQPSGFGFLAWESAQMLIYALVAAGHNPTRASVTKILGSLQNWDGGGALGPYTPSTRSVAPCSVDVQVKGNDFVRKDPPSGLYCNGTLVQAAP